MLDASIAATGRVLLAALFIVSGLTKIGAYEMTTAYIAASGLPFPALSYAAAIAVEIGGGLLLAVGFKARPVAAVLALFTVTAAVFFHVDFADQNQAVHFFKNLAILGGLLQVAATGAGRFSLDARRQANRPAAASALAA